MMLSHDPPSGYEISTDPHRLDLDVIHHFLAQAGFAPLAAPARFMEILRPEIYRTE